MEKELSFRAYGEPAPQGSVTGYPTKGGRGVRIVSKTPGLVEWREVVREAAASAAGPDWIMQDGPAVVHMTFLIPRPKSASKTVDILPSKGKDLDKYVRAVNDAITNAGVWTDDSRVITTTSTKVYAVTPDLTKIYDPTRHQTVPGVEVTIQWVKNDASLL